MEKLFGDFFEGKSILITGHTGFIGSWLSIWLNELKAKVIGYALPPYTNKDNFVVTNLKEKIINITGDVRDFNNVYKIFNKYNPEIIVHLAAQPLVRRSYKIPKETYDINVGGTINVFEAFRNINQSRVLINITTDKCYENIESIKGYCEEDRLGGYDPYSSSKSCSELITSAYRNSFFKNFASQKQKIVASIRSGNVIGGGDWRENRLIPDCIKAILNNQEIIIRNPDAIRPWQYVLELIRGILILAKKMWNGDKEFSGAWNFGPGHDEIYSVQQIVEKILKYLGKGNYKVQFKKESNYLHETKTLILDCSKANKYLDWRPLLNIDETIEFLCDWYMEEKVNYDFNVCQIKNYLKKLS